MSEFTEKAVAHLAAVREHTPLVHNITNLVVMHTTANALLCAGASPVMAHAPEEVEEITGIASALVLNIGTLARDWIASMHLALAMANRRGIPVVIDPVGAGASRMRTDTALALLRESKNAVLRGNASEIMALTGKTGGTRGVDSTASMAAAEDSAGMLALRHACTVCVSGPVDLVTNGTESFTVTGGSPLMPLVTGMGCTATALVAAFAGVCGPKERTLATLSAMGVMSAAGGIAAARCQGPGSFLIAFLDVLHALSATDFAGVRLERKPSA